MTVLTAVAAGGSDPSLAGAAASQPGPTVTVCAAASLTNALNEIKAAFVQQNGAELQINYAASSTLAQQIVQGADAEIYLSADTRWADYLSKRDLVARRRDLLGNRLVIVVPTDSPVKVGRPEDLTDSTIEHLALGEPDSVPAGRYAKQALSQLGLWERLKDKVVAAEDVRHALAYVETAAAEAGIVYATDAAISKKIRVAAEIPAKLTDSIRYPVALLKHGVGNASAEAFYDFLAAPEAVKAFQRHGFTVLKAEPDGRQ